MDQYSRFMVLCYDIQVILLMEFTTYKGRELLISAEFDCDPKTGITNPPPPPPRIPLQIKEDFFTQP